MWRFIAFIIMCAVFLVFMLFNLENKSSISFAVTTIDNIPVFLTAFSSFVLGMLFAIPVVFSLSSRRKKAAAPSGETKAPTTKKRWLSKRRKSRSVTANIDGGKRDIIEPPSSTDEIKKESSPYGID